MGDPAPNPAELVGTSRMAAVLAAVRKEADVVVVDSPPVRLVADAALLALQADGTLVVVDSGRTPRAALVGAAESLGRAGVRVLGAVLNRVPGAPSTAYAAYGTIEPGPVGEPGQSTAAGRAGEA
jgi:Mrp family chromosome partitioning ATPase